MSLLIVDNQFLPYANVLADSAKSNLYISTFKAEMTNKPRGADLLEFFEKIKSAAKRHVRVWFLLNWNTDRRSVPKTNLYASLELKKAGVAVKYLKNNRCCHAKIIVADTDKALIGSHNLSVRSCHNNFELSTLIDDKRSVAQIAEMFEYSFQAAHRL